MPSNVTSRSVYIGRHVCKFFIAAALATLIVAGVLPASAQVQAGANSGPAVVADRANPKAAAKKLTFDAASVRPSSQKFMIKGMDFLSTLSEEPPPQGGLFSWNMPLAWLIGFAYDLRTPQLNRNLSEGLPKWAQMQEGWYTVEARAEGNPTRDDVRQMVRSLLEERFQFSAHIEKRAGQVYELVIAKPRLGLKPHAEGAPCALSSAQVSEVNYPHAYPPYKGVPARCGIFNRELSRVGERRLEMLNETMQQIADTLGSSLPIAVLDKTGLAGRYDAVLDFGPDQVPSNPDSSDELGLPPLPTALEKQLGLKLNKQNALVDVFVIDHIATLSEN
jgi:uncharacterized protein (TIGR03435 family)